MKFRPIIFGRLLTGWNKLFLIGQRVRYSFLSWIPVLVPAENRRAENKFRPVYCYTRVMVRWHFAESLELQRSGKLMNLWTAERLPESYTFHGRDDICIYGSTARCGRYSVLNRWGALCQKVIVRIPTNRPVFKDGKLKGAVAILDIQYGKYLDKIFRAICSTVESSIRDSLHVIIYHRAKKKIIWKEYALYRNFWRCCKRQTPGLSQ